jgi:UDP-2,3-diacylglucosamine hydrolase
VCQWLYASIHPRWTYPIATGWSQHNRITRPKEEEDKIKEVCCHRLETFCNEYATQNPEVQHYMFGHVHLARQMTLNGNRTMTILGDWIDQDTYATFD